jgi:hypothetical protein
MCQLTMLRNASLSARAFARVGTHHISRTRSRTNVAMSAEKLDKTTPDSKWKELLTAEEVWLGGSNLQLAASQREPAPPCTHVKLLIHWCFQCIHVSLSGLALLDERSEGLLCRGNGAAAEPVVQWSPSTAHSRTRDQCLPIIHG